MKTLKIMAMLCYTALSINAADYIALSKGVKSIDLNINGEKFVLERNQNKKNKINDFYANTTNGISQPMILAKGIETIGELEMFEYMKKAQNDSKIVIVDTRTPGWYARLRIPGSVNIPYTSFKTKEDALDMLEDYANVSENEDGSFDFSKAYTLVVYCNGYWCPQTPALVKGMPYSLVKIGYPKEKIKYYRGGMQAWASLGLTTFGSEGSVDE